MGRKATEPKAKPDARQLEQRLTEALQREAEALAHHAATAEILSIIRSSPADAQPVFDAIAVNAVKLCDATGAAVVRYDGTLLHLASHHNIRPESVDHLKRRYPSAPSRGHAMGRAVLDAAVVHVPDLQGAVEFSVMVARQAGARSHVSIPLLHEGRAVGAIGISRMTAGPFSDRQIALLQTFADQAVIAIENARLFTELGARNRALTEALDRQTATADVLKIIAESPAELQPVLEAIAASAVRLCAASDAVIERLDGGRLYNAAHAGAQMKGLVGLPLPLTRQFPGGRAILDRRRVVIDDIQAIADTEYPDVLELLQLNTIHSVAEIPLLSEGRPLGSLAVLRADVRPFTDTDIGLLETFADQAVIAIENARLFGELKSRNRELTETLEQQTAVADILEAISRSPTDLGPTLETIARNAVAVCGATDAAVFLRDGAALVAGSHHGPIGFQAAGDRYGLTRGTVPGRAVIDATLVHVPDFAVTEEFPEGRALAKRFGVGAAAAVPLLRTSGAIGALMIRRTDAGAFSDRQLRSLATFADQAVIAIENVRLFTELQEKNRAVTEALEQQTATSEILRTIAHAQTDAQPVFDAIVRSAAQLCHASIAAVFLTDGRLLYHPANYGAAPEMLASIRARFPRPLDMESTPGIAILTRSVVHVPDSEDEAAIELVRWTGRRLGFRSVITLPMLREDEAVGAITVGRPEPGRFSDAEVELLKTFADQAVIAVENGRLFKELEARTSALTRSVEHLTALGEVGRAVSSTLDLETVLTTIVSQAVRLTGLDGGVVHEYEEDAEEFVHRAQAGTGGPLAGARRAERVRKGEGVIGRTATTLEPIQVSDITVPGAYVGRHRENLIESGIRAILAVPMVREGRLIGCLGMTRNRPGEFPEETIELLRTFATQSALAIQNARLFQEIEVKSRQLEAASRHKSEFLANMSHELRTPLNAIMGFSEVLTERMFGDLTDKQAEYLRDIYDSGQHLLSLINDILDLSKIEAGRMELEATDFDLRAAIENALTLVRERAGRRGVALGREIDERLGVMRGDERKVKQVLLNLLSNALKFTPAGGRVNVRAGVSDGAAEVSVTDTGVGIAPEDQEAVFEEFRQVGTADSKVEGTGLGLALARKFIELHGGRIWVKSRVGEGSTFTFTLPTRRDE